MKGARRIERNRESVREGEGKGSGAGAGAGGGGGREGGEARSRYSDGRSSPRFLRGQKFTVVLISPFHSQSERVSGCGGNFDPLGEFDCKDLKLASAASPPTLLFFPPFSSFIPTFSKQAHTHTHTHIPLHVYLSFITEDKTTKPSCC